MTEIQYKAAKNLKEACAFMAAADGKGRILAGGTDLLVQMKAGTQAPGVIIDVKKIPEMVTIAKTKGGFRIGAATPAAVIGEHQELRKAWPGVVEAINLIGSKQIQGRASPGGNLCNASPAANWCPRWWPPARSLTFARRQAHGPGRAVQHRSRPDVLQKGEIVVLSACRRARRARATPTCA